ncbi:MAG: divalent metal cation transporter [Chloroflexota bacterium]|nr:divalent metal cation transporter [Chloroflexota bacterium]
MPQPVHNYDNSQSPPGSSEETPAPSTNPLARFLKILGPGLISGAADDCPTGIATYAQAGAQTGYGLLWTTLLTLPMLATVQFIAAKVALVQRRGLASVLKAHYPGPIVYTAVLGLIVANVINAGADIGAMAAAIGMFVPISIKILVVPIALFILLFLIFGNFNLIENTFKWLTLALMGYVVTSFLSRPNVGALLHGTFIPQLSFSTAFLTLVVAALGGNVSPYLMFWQADMEVDQEKSDSAPDFRHGKYLRVRAATRQLSGIAWDTNIGMIFSNLIIFFIEVSSAETLFKAGKHNVSTAVQAAEALRPLLGNAATVLWAVGMVGAGLLAVPALTGSIADATAAIFGWGQGLNQAPDRAKRFYGVLAAATVVGLGINFLGISPIKALVVSAALNGFLSPPLLILLMLVGNKKDAMGEYKNGLSLNILGWATVAVMTLAAMGLLYTIFA